MSKQTAPEGPRRVFATQAAGRCSCGAVAIEIDVPAVWAWHDHSAASRRAHGAFCATYVGSWKSRFRLMQGAEAMVHYEDEAAGTTRGFCGRCGAPITYERRRSPKIVNIPRALFDAGVGREPRYHLHIEETPEWAYSGGPVAPLKGYPGVVWERPRKRRSPAPPI